LIGINVAVRAGAQGIGFALPIDDVKKVAAEMMSTRRMAATWHGLVADEQLRPAGEGRAVVLSDVQPGSPAEAAGFRPGDQVVRVGELAVTTPLDIERGLLEATPGHPTRVQVRRSGQDQALSLDVKPLPKVSAADATEQVWRVLGLRATPVSSDYVVAVDPKLRGGLFVQAVQPGGPAEQARIQRGDILIGMNVGVRHWETIRADNILFILRQPEFTQSPTLQFYIVRRNNIHRGVMSLAEVPSIATLSR
jgi:serine protease Do